MVTAHVYDEFGREEEHYLPFTSNMATAGDITNDGKFKLDPFQEQKAFYLAQLGAQSQNYYYDSVNFEPSPLNRPQKTMPAGDSWVGSGRGVGQSFQMNAASEVRQWIVPATAGNVPASIGYYAAGTLYRNITTDEQSKRVVEYMDLQGRVLLKKIEINPTGSAVVTSHTDWLCTYYVYDDMSSLRWVIQPGGVQKLIAGSWAFDNTTYTTSTIAKELCFYYEYDGHQRMIIKKVPGANIEEMVYDTRDRLVMSRHGNLAAQGYWLINKYDNLNRLTQNYLALNSRSRVANQTSSDSSINYPSVSASDLMQENYYDNYGWGPSGNISSTVYAADLNATFFTTSYNTAPQYAQPVIPDYTDVKGKPTGWKVRIFGTGTYLRSVIFYDSLGRVIQTQKDNVSGGVDQVTTQYNFASRPLYVLHRQVKVGVPARTIRERTKYTYDHAGRVTLISKKVGPTGLDKTIASNTYDELGQLQTKTLGAGLESQTFDYNVRGWLLGVNRASFTKGTQPASRFSYELAYDNLTPTVSPGSYGTAQYNGNIAGLLWRSIGDWENRKYNFTYDAANRLMKADFTQFNNAGNAFDLSGGMDYSLVMGDGVHADSAYDANGNIQHLQQKGFKINSSVVIDDLRYTYQNNNSSNKLAKVTDAVSDPTTKMGDFKDGTNSGTDDYAYDVNGNLTSDQNKAISSILYTHQNTPYQVTIPGKGTISYLYDNLGEKLKKTVVDNATGKTTVWLYMDNFVYQNDTLQFFSTEEGRARYDTTQTTAEATTFNFDYFLKDHLGNVRMVLTEQKDTAKYPTLSFEGAASSSLQQTQDKIWENKSGSSINIVNSRINKPAGFDTVSTNQYVMLVRKSTGSIGGAKLLKVMAGDRIHTGVDYFYNMVNANNTGADGLGSLITNLATSMVASAQVSSVLKSGASTLTSALSGNPSFVSWMNMPNATSGANNAPKAYLNILFFDEQFRPDNVATVVIPVPYLIGQRGTISRLGASAIAARQNGYVYVYFSNESNELVYFDNLILTHEKGPVTEETHYYPFGLTMAGISSAALGKLGNKIKFQGQELQNKEFGDGSGLEMYEFKWRMHDPQTGRFWSIDPLADKYVYNSTYAFSENKVTTHVELEGLEAEYIFQKAKEELAGSIQGAANFVDNTVGYFTKYTTSTEVSSTPVSTTSVGSTITTNTSTNFGGKASYVLHNNTNQGNAESLTKTTTTITADTKIESKTPGATLTNKTTLSTSGVITNELGVKAKVAIEGVPATISGGAAMSTDGQRTITAQGTTIIPGSVAQGTAQVQYNTNGTTQSASVGVGGQVTTGKTTTSTIVGIKFSWEK